MPAGVPRVAAEQAAASEPAASEEAMFFQSFNRVMGAGGIKAAVGPNEGADAPLVGANHKLSKGLHSYLG